jgi:Flp pilus assembly protein TadD
VPLLQQALQKNVSSTIQIPELRYYLGDALARLDRYAEAEPVLLDEVRLFPHDLRARAGLAMLYRATGRPTEADRQLDAIERLAPGGEGQALAGKLRRMFRGR